MRRRFKTTLFWLLLVALPAQGLATATMLFCDLAALGERDARRMMMSGGHHHSAGTHAAGAEDATATHHSAANHCNGSAHGTKCAGCMAHCAGTLLTPSATLMPPLAMRDMPPASSTSVPSPGPGIDGPYRPPRSLLV